MLKFILFEFFLQTRGLRRHRSVGRRVGPYLLQYAAQPEDAADSGRAEPPSAPTQHQHESPKIAVHENAKQFPPCQ